MRKMTSSISYASIDMRIFNTLGYVKLIIVKIVKGKLGRLRMTL